MGMLEHCPSIARLALRRAFGFSNARTYARYSQRTTHLALLSHLTFRAQGGRRFSGVEGGVGMNFAALVHEKGTKLMGYNTAIMICNDGLSEIRACSKEFVDGIYEHLNRGGDIHGLGYTAQVLPADHADATQLIAVGGNFATKVYTGWYCGSHHTVEGQVALLKQWADSLGYEVSPKPKHLSDRKGAENA